MAKRKEDSDLPNSLEDAKKPRHFSAAEFRSALHGIDNLKHIREFISIAESKSEERDVVLEYLEDGGSVLELVSILDITAQSDMTTALPVFRSIQIILLRIQSVKAAEKYSDDAKLGIEKLFANFLPAIQSMIAVNIPKNRKVVFNMLTSIVTFDKKFAREILGWFNLTAQQQQQITEPGLVRKAFIMFLLSFFVEKDVTLFRPLLEKKGLLSTIFPNLIFDHASTVCVVLTLLKEKLLENGKVLKTTKLNIFNTQVIQSLIQLYDWVGPRGVQTGWKKPRDSVENKTEFKEMVANAVTDFLRVLCCSRKYGIAFWDKGLGFKAPMNELIFTALELIPKPWSRLETEQLMVDILKNSPDLIKPCLSRMESSLQPRESAMWTKTLGFLTQVYQSLRPEVLLPATAEVLSPSQTYSALKGVFFVPAVMKSMATAVGPDQSVNIRYHAMSLLTTIVQKLNDFLMWLREHGMRLDRQIKSMANTLTTVVPHSDEIRKMWRHDTKNSDIAEPWESNVHCAVADFLLALVQFDPLIISKPRKLCKTLTKDISEMKSEVQIAVFQAISILEPSLLTPNAELFDIALKTLLKLCCFENARNRSLSAVVKMLFSSGLWSSNAEELDCWLGSWLDVTTSAQDFVAHIFVNALKEAMKTIEQTCEMETDLSNADCADAVEDRESRPTCLLETILNIMSVGSTLGSKLERKETKKFLTDVALQIGFLYGPTKYFIDLTSKHRDLFKFDIAGYFKQPENLDYLPDCAEKSFCQWLLRLDTEEFSMIDSNSNNFMKSSLFIISVFYLKHFIKKSDFNSKFSSRCRIAMLSILEQSLTDSTATKTSDCIIASNYQSNSIFFVKTMNVLLHVSGLIDYFSVVSKNAIQSSFTSWLRQLFSTIEVVRSTMSDVLPLLWKQRFLGQLHSHLRRKKRPNPEEMVFWLELISPTINEIVPILNTLCEASDLPRGWGRVAALLIRTVGTQTLPQPLQMGLMQFLCSTCAIEDCETAFDEALLDLITNHPNNVHYIPSDFIHKISLRRTGSTAIADVAEMYLQVDKNLNSLLEFIQKSPKLHFSHLLPQFFDRVLKERYVFDSSTNVMKLEDLLKDRATNGKQLRLDQCVKDVMNIVYPVLLSSLRNISSSQGDDININDYLNVIRSFLHQGSATELQEFLLELSISEKYFPPELMVDVLPGLGKKEHKKYLLQFITSLCDPSTSEDKWSLHSKVLRDLSNGTDISKACRKFSRSSAFSDYCSSTIRELSTKSNPAKVAILSLILSGLPEDVTDSSLLNSIFAQLTNHAEFFNVLLCNSLVKEELTSLLLLLLRRCPNLMVQGQVPVFLSAYNATLSRADQNIFAILQLYEINCIELSQFEPLFWGESAVNHYSVRESLWNPASAKNVLDLLKMEIVKSTIAQFPLNRLLNGAPVPESNGMYDPAFLLQLFINLFSPSAVSYCESFVLRGGLSLTFSALSSEDKEMRLAAATVMHRFYTHVQLLQRSKHKAVWLHLIDCVRYGIEDISAKPLPSIVTVFLARAILEISDPLSPVYNLHNFLIAKSSFNLHTLPEFIPLFFSSDHNYQKHKNWILQVLRDGIRRKIDLFLVKNSISLRVLFCYYESLFCSAADKIVILQILNSILQSSESYGVLKDYGLLSWLRQISSTIGGELLEPFLNLLKRLFSITQLSKKPNSVKSRKREEIYCILKALMTSSKCNTKEFMCQWSLIENKRTFGY